MSNTLAADASAELSIALIEDNPADQRLLLEMVVGSDAPRFEVSTFVRLQPAIDELRDSDDLACVVLDLSLPDAEGIDAIERVREALVGVPIVIITGRDDEETALRALQAGAQDYLIKGRIDSDALRRAVRYAIERMRAEEDLDALAAENEVILDSAGEGICGIDREGRLTFANPAAAELMGCDRADLVGRDIHELFYGASLPRERCPLLRSLQTGRPVSGEDRFRRASGSLFPVERTLNPISGRGVFGGVLTFSDLTERKRFESQLSYVADHDTATGLFNRERFAQSVEREIALADQSEATSCLLLLDLDNFKYVNDTLGHGAGDELLRSIARLLEETFSGADVIARLGGDEFGVLISNADSDQAMEAAMTLAEAVRDHAPSIGRQPLRVTASVGATMIDRRELTAEQLLVEADVAMYEAKHAGRDRAAIFRPGSTSPAREAGLTWTDRIRRALDEDRFIVHAQPILDFHSDRFSHHELLVRMVDEEGEMVSPGDFIPAAERFGLIQTIDAFMVGQAAHLAAKARLQGNPMTVEVNLSGRSIGDPEIPGVIRAAISDSGASPSDLVFEITETAAVANLDRAREFAEELRGLGCAFALDDFGAGFGSFYYLKYFPLDYLKLDGEFVKNLASSEVDQRMVRAMVDVARGLDLRTIAEMIEDGQSAELLRGMGVDFGQGFHLARPAMVGPDWPG